MSKLHMTMLNMMTGTTLTCHALLAAVKPAVLSLLGVTFMCCSTAAFADTVPALYSSFAGYVNFVGTQKTLRTGDNTSNTTAASLFSGTTTASGSAATTATLSGLPSSGTNTIKAAYLYWAGSGNSTDTSVTFENTTVTAGRTYTISNAAGVSGINYFSGVADVTSLVAAKGNGTYTFSGLTASNGSPWSDSQAVMAGWALLVIYENSTTERFRVLNVYEGFQPFYGSSISLAISNFTVPSSNIDGKMAHLTWEGDSTNSGSLNGFTEQLTFNGSTLTDSNNPSGNQFNSVSTIRSGAVDSASYGIDFDTYDVSSYVTAGQTSATSVYSSGGDLVLLSMEVMSVTNTPVADLGISMTRNDSLVLGENASYSITVTNNGPNDHSGTVTVTTSLPYELYYVSGGGTNWSCSSSDFTNVTCLYTGGLTNGATSSSLTLVTLVRNNFSTSVTTSVTVAGTLFDNVSSNNTASDTATMTVPGWVFTDKACVDGQPFYSSSQTCSTYNWGTPTAGTAVTGIYITKLSNGTPTKVSNSNNPTTQTMAFALSCNNPTSTGGIRPTFSATSNQIPTCTANGATPSTWSTGSSLTFNTRSPSSGPYSFTYYDVGQVTFYVEDASANKGNSGKFVVKPSTFKLDSIQCTSSAGCTTTNNPGATGAAGTAFIAAGYPFSVTVTALASDGLTVTKNYGKETSPETVKLTTAVVHPTSSEGGRSDPPSVSGSFGSFSNGSATGTAFYWNEVGGITLTPSVGDGDYLGAGDVTGTAISVGRFYPAEFTLSSTSLSNRTSLSGCGSGCSTFTYVGEQMTANFTLTAVAKDGVTTTKNYSGNYASTGSSWVKLNAGGAVTAGTDGNFHVAGITTGSTIFPACGSTPTYPCITPSAASGSSGTFASGSATITLPVTVYRDPATAAANVSLKLGVAPKDDDGVLLDSYDLNISGGASNNKRYVTTADVRYGRMKFASAHGSELHSLTINAYTQYWNGSTWVTNTDDSTTPLVTSDVSLSNWITLTSGAVSVSSVTRSLFSSGVNSFVLSVPGQGKYGSVDMSLSSGASTYSVLKPPTSSTVSARARYGVFKGNDKIIDIRESY